MRVIDRIIFFLAAIGLLLFSSLLGLLALNLVSWTNITSGVGSFYQQVAGREEIGIVGLLLFLGGLRLGQLSLQQRNKRGITVQETSLGKVKVSLAAVENLVRRLVTSVAGVKQVQPSIKGVGDKIIVSLRVAVVPEVSVPKLTEHLQILVKEGIADVLGIKVSQVKVLVDNMLAETARVE